MSAILIHSEACGHAQATCLLCSQREWVLSSVAQPSQSASPEVPVSVFLCSEHQVLFSWLAVSCTQVVLGHVCLQPVLTAWQSSGWAQASLGWTLHTQLGGLSKYSPSAPDYGGRYFLPHRLLRAPGCTLVSNTGASRCS